MCRTMCTITDRITYRQWLQALALSLLLTMGWGTSLYAQVGGDTAEPGVLIVAVLPGSPAAAANIVRGDIILAVNGEAVNDPVSLVELIQTAAPGDTVELIILHGDEERVAVVTLANQDGLAYLGVRPYIDAISMMPGEMMPGEILPEEEEVAESEEASSEVVPGAAVVTVAEGTPAEEAGLQPGDVIIRVNGEAVADAGALVERIGAYAPGDEVVLEVLSPSAETAAESTKIVVILAAHPEDESSGYLGVQVVAAAEYADEVSEDEVSEEDVTTEMMPHMVMPRGGYMYPAPEYHSNGPRAYRFWMQPRHPHMQPSQRFHWRHYRPHGHSCHHP